MRMNMRQKINPWLGIALVGLMCFWVVLYFFVHKTDAFGFNFLQVSDKNEHRYLKEESVIYTTPAASDQAAPVQGVQ